LVVVVVVVVVGEGRMHEGSKERLELGKNDWWVG
jgi:hypothetical protein